jgi:pantothenate kinase
MTLNAQVTELADRIRADRTNGNQFCVAIAGAPGSGKSTLATETARRLIQQRTPTVVVPMDGFHLDNPVLDAMKLSHRKGAPDTFDSAGFMRLINTLRGGTNVYFPRFDRTLDLSVAGAVEVSVSTPVVIFEGNYLMYDAPIWRDLAPMWDLTVRLDVPMAELRARLIQRWLSQNLGPAAAIRRAETNDLANAQSVIDLALPCDLTLTIHPEV